MHIAILKVRPERHAAAPVPCRRPARNHAADATIEEMDRLTPWPMHRIRWYMSVNASPSEETPVPPRRT